MERYGYIRISAKDQNPRLPKEFDTYYEQWRLGKISLRDAAKALQINYSTFYRRCKERMENSDNS